MNTKKITIRYSIPKTEKHKHIENELNKIGFQYNKINPEQPSGEELIAYSVKGLFPGDYKELVEFWNRIETSHRLMQTKIEFESDNGRYKVKCPIKYFTTIHEYVNRTESYLSIIDNILVPVRPLVSVMDVTFCSEYDKGKYCDRINNGEPAIIGYSTTQVHIYMKAKGNYDNDCDRYGGLLHESIHGYLIPCKYNGNSWNKFPEAFTLIIQIAVLDKIGRLEPDAKNHSDKLKQGKFTATEDEAKLISSFASIYTNPDYSFRAFHQMFNKLYTSKKLDIGKMEGRYVNTKDIRGLLSESGVKDKDLPDAGIRVLDDLNWE